MRLNIQRTFLKFISLIYKYTAFCINLELNNIVIFQSVQNS